MARVLIVEDSPTQAAQLELVLAVRGFETEIAKDGEAAVAAVQRAVPDVVVSDIVMPGMTGYDLCRQLKADPATAQVPVILVSSLSEPMDIIRGLECGADNFLTKPYQAEHLVHRVTTLLHNRQVRAAGHFAVGVEIVFLGRRFTITSEKEQILDLLVSTFEDTVRANRELHQSRAELAVAHAKIEEYARQLEGKVRVSEEKYALLMENAHDAFVVTDTDGRVVEANRMVAELLGRPKEELLGVDIRQLLAVSATEPFAFDHSVLSATGSARFADCQIRRADGGALWVNISASSVDIDGGTNVLLILHDLTERRNTESQLRQVQKMDALGRLTGGVAHDFNNLLGVIIGNVDLLSDQPELGSESKELVQEALDAAMRGAELTQRLLAFARKQPLAPRVIDINAILPGASNMLRRTLGAAVEVQLHLQDALWQTRADPSQVEDALLNLAINARDAMPNGGRLVIETANVMFDGDYIADNFDVTAGEYVQLSVSDEGAGMPPDVIERAFEPFFTTKPPGQGTGLGLSMIYGFVKQSGGHVKIYSEVGHGTTIRLYLPRAGKAEGGAEAAIAVAPSLPTGTEKILLVEDNPGLRAVVLRMLTDLGYAVIEANNGEEALERLAEDPAIDLLFTDVVMPGELTGPQLATVARERRPTLKVLLTSGYSEVLAGNGAGKLQGTSLIRKPYRKDELAQKLRSILQTEG
jgi:PAS domain S-box-containing protein